VFIFAGLLENASEVVVPEEIHADTQGQSLPAFGLATMLGVELPPRIRNWKDLIFYRASAGIRLSHIDSLFGEDEVIDWKLIETHWVDLIRGESRRPPCFAASATSPARTASTRPSGNWAGRTIVLLRYLFEPELRESITTITNRVERSTTFPSGCPSAAPGHRRQRPGPHGEDRQVQRAARQLGDLLQRRRADGRAQPAGRRGVVPEEAGAGEAPAPPTGRPPRPAPRPPAPRAPPRPRPPPRPALRPRSAQTPPRPAVPGRSTIRVTGVAWRSMDRVSRTCLNIQAPVARPLRTSQVTPETEEYAVNRSSAVLCPPT
jgi:hypothetical protein